MSKLHPPFPSVETDAAVRAPVRPMRILLADDNEIARKIVGTTLRGRGHKVITAIDGLDAYERAVADPPDLILSDVLMPRMDGFALCRALKETTQLRGVPVVFFSATFLDEADRQLAEAVGASDLIVKSTDTTTFLSAIERALSQHRAHELPVPAAPRIGDEALDRLHRQSLADKLNQKVQELEHEQRALSLSESRYRHMVETALEGILLLDEEARISFTNRRMAGMLGYVVPELIGRTVFEFMDGRCRGEAEARFARRRQGLSERYDFRLQRKDGSDLWVVISANPLHDSDGVFTGALAMVTDITERRRAEEEAKMLAKFPEQNPSPVMRVSQEGQLQYANPASQQLLDDFGYRIGEPVALEWRQEIEQALSSRSQRYLDIRVGDRDYWLIIAPIDEAGYTNLYGIDVTERNRFEQERVAHGQQMEKALLDTIRAVALTIEKRDPYTSGHQQRVAVLATAIAEAMALPEAQVEGIRVGGMIHDIGKIYIPSEILNRPGKLTEMEFGIVRTHSEVGYDIIHGIDFPWPVAQMVLQHHERIDGSGYPQGLKGDEIILEARILCVADVVEAMASHRPYRAGLGIEAALAEIERGRGTAYDPPVVDTCLRLFREEGFELELPMRGF